MSSGDLLTIISCTLDVLLEIVQVLSVCVSMLSELLNLLFEPCDAIATRDSKNRPKSSDSIEPQTDRTCTSSRSTSKAAAQVLHP